MFLESSRYFDVKTVSTKTADGRTVTAIRLRHLPYVAGTPTVIKQNDRLDVIAQRKYGDGCPRCGATPCACPEPKPAQ